MKREYGPKRRAQAYAARQRVQSSTPFEASRGFMRSDLAKAWMAGYSSAARKRRKLS